MEKESINVTFAPGCEDATLRVIHLSEDNRLPEVEPLNVEISGTIDAVYEYLEKRLGQGQFEQKDCHIIVNREKLSIALTVNETDSRRIACVDGSLAYYPKYLQFGINSDKLWEPSGLSRFLKLNRAFFNDVAQNMELVTILKNFKARINQKVENSREDNGSRIDNFGQIVNSNLPKSFNLAIPIFKGRPVENIEVEILADIDGREIKLSLCSPGAEVIVEEERNRAIDEQIAKIRQLAPEIAIIEQ